MVLIFSNMRLSLNLLYRRFCVPIRIKCRGTFLGLPTFHSLCIGRRGTAMAHGQSRRRYRSSHAVPSSSQCPRLLICETEGLCCILKWLPERYVTWPAILPLLGKPSQVLTAAGVQCFKEGSCKGEWVQYKRAPTLFHAVPRRTTLSTGKSKPCHSIHGHPGPVMQCVQCCMQGFLEGVFCQVPFVLQRLQSQADGSTYISRLLLWLSGIASFVGNVKTA